MLFFLFAFFSSYAHADTCGQLAAVKGPGVEVLRIQSAHEGEKVRYGMKIEENKVMPIECDDIILTGRDSSVKVILANGKVSLGPDSRIEIAMHTKQKEATKLPKVNLINLTYGKMRALIQKRPGSASTAKPANGSAAKTAEHPVEFRVRTFSAVAGVRGTDFFTSYEPNTGLTENATIEGSVEVQQAGTSQSVIVDDGKQVSVEVTPAAVAAAKARIESGKEDFEPPKNLPDANMTPKPLEVVPIRDSVRNEIRVASAVARDDKEFAHKKAVETLGKPETWTMEREKLPEKFDKLKNEF